MTTHSQDPPRRQPWLPGLVLVALLAGVYASALASGATDLVLRQDSESYLDVAEFDWSRILGSTRTVGYPLLLQATEELSPDRSLMPHLHFLLFLGGIFVFWRGLLCLGVPGWTALVAAAPIAFSELLRHYGGALLTDTLSAGLALMTLGLTCAVAARPAGIGRWLGLALLIAATYQVRPAYLFLILWIPMVGTVLYRGLHRGVSWRRVGRIAAGLVLASVLPFLIFATYRWKAIGDWGLVSFGGYNVIGISGSLLSKDVVNNVDREYRLLATRILADRWRHAQERDDGRFQPIQEREFESARSRMAAWYAEYNFNIWTVAVRKARIQAQQFGLKDREARPYVNEQLAGLSKEVFSQRPGDYVYWIAQGLRLGVARTVNWVRGLGLGLCLALLAYLALALARAIFQARAADRKGALLAESRGVGMVWFLAATFFVANLLLIVLVEPPVDRYLHGAGLLLPGAAFALAWDCVRRAVLLLRGAWRARGGEEA